MIKAGRSKEVYAAYKKKYKENLSSSTLSTWKKNMDKILATDKKKGCRPSYKQAEIKEMFDNALFKKIEELEYDLEGYVGLKEMAQDLAATDEFKNEPHIQSMTFTFHYCERIVKKYNMMVTSTCSSQVILSKEAREMECARLHAVMSSYSNSCLYNWDEVSHFFIKNIQGLFEECAVC